MLCHARPGAQLLALHCIMFSCCGPGGHRGGKLLHLAWLMWACCIAVARVGYARRAPLVDALHLLPA